MGVADVRDARASSTDGVAEGATVRALPGLWQCRAGIEVGDRPDASRHQRDMGVDSKQFDAEQAGKNRCIHYDAVRQTLGGISMRHGYRAISYGSPDAVALKSGLESVEPSADAIDVSAEGFEFAAVLFRPLLGIMLSRNDLPISPTSRSGAEDASDAEDRQTTQFHNRLLRRMEDTAALAAVNVIKH